MTMTWPPFANFVSTSAPHVNDAASFLFPGTSHVGSLCVGIIFVSYAMQVKYKPFLDPNLDVADSTKAAVSGAELVYVRGALTHAR